MGILSWLTGGGKAVEKGAEALSGGFNLIDAAFHTDQEKAEGRKGWFDLWIKGQAVIQNESTARAITRRLIAVSVVGTFLLLVLVGCGMIVLGFDSVPVYSKDGNEIIATISKTGKMVEFLGELKFGVITLTIIIFYFGYYGLQKVIGKFKRTED